MRPFPRRRERLGSRLLAGLALSGAAVLAALLGSPPAPAIYLAAGLGVFLLGSSDDLRVAAPAALIALVALELTLGVAEDAYVPLAIVSGGASWIGLQSGGRRRLTAALEQRSREIAAEQLEFERLAVRRERARIAGELHDIVSHHLSMIVVQAGAGRMAPDADAEASRLRFVAIREGGRQALGELASLVDVLEAEPSGSASETIGALLASARSSGVVVTAPPGALDRLPDAVAAVAHRLLQEGLTNVVKHGAAAGAELTLERSAQELRIELRNARAGASSLARTGSGSGLEVMRSRVAALGGELDAGPVGESGWRLRARLPVAHPAGVEPADGYLARMS